jgi:SAM-dependent methyltransferase
MSDVWSDRAEAYRTSTSHASGADLDAVVEMCNPHEGVKVLDVASGGGHVARKLRERGAQVVTSDPAPGMQADVVCAAEDLPFADGSFDVVVTRIAPHHFADLGKAVGEMARVSNRVVVVEDTLYTSEEVEAAEKLRDPSHVRNLSETEWRDLLESAGLEIERVEFFDKAHDLGDWLARTGCTGDEAARVRALLASVTSDDGATWRSSSTRTRSSSSRA